MYKFLNNANFHLLSFYDQNFFSESLPISEHANEEFRRQTTNLIAFVEVESAKTGNSPTDLPRVVLLAEFNGLEGSSVGRQTFELVEFNHDEISAIERFCPFDQIEFLRYFLASSNFKLQIFNFVFFNLTNLVMFKRNLTAYFWLMAECVFMEVRDILRLIQ